MVQEGVAAHPKCAVVVTTHVDKDELLRELGNRSSLILECLFEPFASSAPGLIEQIHYWLCVVCKVHTLRVVHSALGDQRDTRDNCMDEDSTERPCLRRLKKHCMEQDGRGGNDIATLCQTKSPHGIITQNHPPLAWSLAGDSQPRSLLKPLERSAADATQRAARPKDSAKAQPCILAVRRCRFFLYVSPE